MRPIALNGNRLGLVFTGVAIAGMAAFSVNRFMAPHDPVGGVVLSGPPPGSEWSGRTFENFRLRSIDGKTVDSSSMLGRRPVVVVFHGGKNSPFAMAQLVMLAASSEIRAADALVYVLTIENPAEVSRFAHRLWQLRGVTSRQSSFVFVRDEYGSFSRQYVGEPVETNPGQPGILTRGTFVIGKDRKILYAYVNLTPKLQPSESQLLAAVSRASKELGVSSSDTAKTN